MAGQEQQQPSERTKDKRHALTIHVKHAVSKIATPFRSNDGRQILLSNAIRNVKGSIRLNADDVGPSGSILRKKHITDADDGIGCMPHLSWADPKLPNIKSYALVCEDLDATYPDHMHHGIFYDIPPARRTATPDDVEKQAGENTPRLTAASWKFVTTHGSNSYLVPGPPANEVTHRYVFTIIALNEDRLTFERPEKATKKDFHKAIEGKVVTWGQWIGSLSPPAAPNGAAAGKSTAAPKATANGADGQASAGQTSAGHAPAGVEASPGQPSSSCQTGLDGRVAARD